MYDIFYINNSYVNTWAILPNLINSWKGICYCRNSIRPTYMTIRQHLVILNIIPIVCLPLVFHTTYLYLHIKKASTRYAVKTWLYTRYVVKTWSFTRYTVKTSLSTRYAVNIRSTRYAVKTWLSTRYAVNIRNDIFFIYNCKIKYTSTYINIILSSWNNHYGHILFNFTRDITTTLIFTNWCEGIPEDCNSHLSFQEYTHGLVHINSSL